MSDLEVVEASVNDAAEVCAVIQAAMRVAVSAQERVGPPATVQQTVESVAEVIERDGGLLCRVDGVPAGALLFADEGNGALRLRGVATLPHLQSRGVATAVVGVAEEVAADRGYDDVVLRIRSDLPATVNFWQRRGYAELAPPAGTCLTLGKALPVEVVTRSPHDSWAVGGCIARLAKPGDVVILTGDLGAGKTTLTQGIAKGLRVRGEVTSPTFVIARVHPPMGHGPALVHVDAYRLGSTLELDDLDLDAALDESVTVVEWGQGIAEGLSTNLLSVAIERTRGGDTVAARRWGQAAEEDAEDVRSITVTPTGARWVGAGVRSAVTASSTYVAP